MRNCVVIFILFLFSHQNHAQFSAFITKNQSKDLFFNERNVLGIELGREFRIKDKFSIYLGVNTEYAFLKKTKTEYYSNHNFEDLDDAARGFVVAEGFLVRGGENNTWLISPKLQLGYSPIEIPNWFEAHFFTGIYARFQLHNYYLWRYVSYSENYTEIIYFNGEVIDKKNYLYNWYIPIGIQINLKKIPISLKSSYDLRIKKTMNHVPWLSYSRLHDNFNISLGYSFGK